MKLIKLAAVISVFMFTAACTQQAAAATKATPVPTKAKAAAAKPAAVKTKQAANEDYSIAYVNDFDGECEIKRKGEDIPEALQDLYIPLYEGDTISTGSDAAMEVVFDDSTIIKMDSRSTLVIRNLNRKKESKTMLELLKGRVVAIVKKLMEKDEFSVKTKMAMAAVKGTEFIVDSGDEKVGVYEGAVEVSGMDMSGNVLNKVVLQKDQETIIIKNLRRPDRIRPISANFVKRYKEVKDLRAKIEMMRELRRSGKIKKFKVERRLKRIESLRTMMNADPDKFNNLPEGQKALVKEIMKEEPALNAQKEELEKEKRKDKMNRLKMMLKKKKTDNNEE